MQASQPRRGAYTTQEQDKITNMMLRSRLKRDFPKPPLKDVTHIAIDEIAIRKGHKYLTIVMDLHTGRVIFVGDGRGAERGQRNKGFRKRPIYGEAQNISPII